MSSFKFNPVTLLLLIATICSTLLSFADVLPKAWLPYVVIVGAVANACAARLVHPVDSRGNNTGINPALALLMLLPLLLLTAACDGSRNVASAGRAIEAGAREAQREIAGMQKRGELDEETAEKLTAIFYEVEANGHDLSLVTNWEAMPAAEKQRTVRQFIGYFAASAERLDEQGVLSIKSEKARKRVESFKLNFNRALGVLRLIEATLSRTETLDRAVTGDAS